MSPEVGHLHARIYVVLGWGGVLVLAGCGAVVVWNGHWLSLLQLAFFLGGAAYLMFFDGGLPPLLKFLFVLAALINAVGWIWDEYTKIVWYDEVAHLYTTFAITLALGCLAYRRAATYLRDRHVDHFIVVLSFGVAAGALWEVIEWIILLREFRDSPVSDIVYDSLGAIGAAGLSVWFARSMAYDPQGATQARSL
jgi:hypothetical protein